MDNIKDPEEKEGIQELLKLKQFKTHDYHFEFALKNGKVNKIRLNTISLLCKNKIGDISTITETFSYLEDLTKTQLYMDIHLLF